MGIRCDPSLPGRQDGPAHPECTRQTLRNSDLGVLPDVGHRADVRSARLLPALGGKDYEDKRPQQRFIDESKRLLGVLDRQLEGRDWIVDDYSIADIATLGWVNALVESYAAGDIVGLSNYSNIQAWLGRGLARPAVQRGLRIPARSA
jgi:glutathione S-transferase